MQIEQEEENNYTIEKSQEKRFSCKGCAKKLRELMMK